VTPETFQQAVLQEPGLVLVEFWSKTCPHCLRLSPHFAAAAEADDSDAKFVKVLLQDARPLFHEHRVNAVPTLVLFRGGTEVAREAGAKTSDEILAWVKAAL
jgi:thioredoxin 2